MFAVPCQRNLTESDHVLWLDSFESLLSEVTTKCSGNTFVTGDTNIDLIGLIYKTLQNMFHTFKLQQHITMVTRIYSVTLT